MKIAIPTKEGNRIDDHFGHCEFYSIFTVEENLAGIDVKIMFAGGIGNGAISKLNARNIEVIRNCSGDVDVLIQRLPKRKNQRRRLKLCHSRRTSQFGYPYLPALKDR